jgi:hypothetical protein
MSQRVGSAVRPESAARNRAQRAFTVRTRFTTVDDVRRGLGLLLREDGTLFVAAPNARVEIAESLIVVFTTSDGSLSIEREAIVDSRTGNNAFPGSQAGVILKILAEGDADAPPPPEPADAGLFVESSNNPLAGLNTNMIALFVDCNLEENKDEISESYDDVPVFNQAGTGGSLPSAPPVPPEPVAVPAPVVSPPVPAPVVSRPVPVVSAPAPVVSPPPPLAVVPEEGEPYDSMEMLAPVMSRPPLWAVTAASMVAGAVIWFGVQRARGPRPPARPPIASVRQEAPPEPAPAAPEPPAAESPRVPLPEAELIPADQPDARPSLCAVRVTSEPSRATFFLGERKLGSTPTHTLQVPCGAPLVLMRARYQPTWIHVPEEPGAGPSRLKASLVRPAAVVDLDSVPSGAEVWLDDELVDHTPAELPVPRFGSHTLSVRAAGYAPWRKRVNLREPAATLRAALVPLRSRRDVSRR